METKQFDSIISQFVKFYIVTKTTSNFQLNLEFRIVYFFIDDHHVYFAQKKKKVTIQHDLTIIIQVFLGMRSTILRQRF